MRKLIEKEAPYYKGKNFKISETEIDINYFNIPKSLENTLNKLGFLWSSEYQSFKKI